MNETPKKLLLRSQSTSSCRLCRCEFSSSKNLTNLIRRDDLLMKINVLCSFSIREEDAVKTACRSCIKKLNSYWEFRTDCIKKEQDKEVSVTVKRGICSPDHSNKKQNIGHETSTNTIEKSILNDETVPQDIFEVIENNCRQLCTRNQNKSILHNHSFSGMENFSVEQIFLEMKTNNPLLIKVFDAVSGKNGESESSIRCKYAFVYSILMNARWHELSLVQRVITILAIEGGCTSKFQNRLNKLGVCLSKSSREILLQTTGGYFLDIAVEKVKAGGKFRGTGDNWDLRVLKDHLRKDVKNDDLHLFASNLISNRINFNHLDNSTPKADIRSISRSIFSPSTNEIAIYCKNAKILIARIATQFFPELSPLKKIIPNHIKHKYSKEMATKSLIVSMPIINANEQNYPDCVKILRTYESWISEIYHKAGLIDKQPVMENPALTETSAETGQPKNFTINTSDDLMKDMKIMFSGDQLTRVRFAGAKDLLSGAHTPSDRLEHCSPFKSVMWHTKASFLQYCYNHLYKGESVSEVGTLKYFREKYNRINVKPAKIIDNYEGAEELFLSVGKSYIVVALIKLFEVENINGKPNGINSIQTFFDDVFQKFVDIFVTQKSLPTYEEQDFIENYGLNIIFLTILLIQLKDTAAEGDGDRNLVNQKFLLSLFKSMGSMSRYAIEMFVSIAQTECLLPPRLSEEFKWGYFVNWRGGSGKNVEEDLAQEISNRLSKSIVQRMGANKTINSINKICRSVSGIKCITEQFDQVFNIHPSSVQHTTRSSESDEKNMIEELMKLKPFDHIPGRKHSSFNNIKRSPLLNLNIIEFHQWLEKQRSFMS